MLAVSRKQVRVEPNPAMSIEDTIFKTAPDWAKPMLTERFCVSLFWSDQAVGKIEQTTSNMLKNNSNWSGLKAQNPDLIKFMQTECDFAIEHADGTPAKHLIAACLHAL